MLTWHSIRQPALTDPSLSKGVGPDDFRRSFLISTILPFCAVLMPLQGKTVAAGVPAFTKGWDVLYCFCLG